MIKNITVKKLYGVFDHTIDVKEGNITLILGENGLGKTVILKMIKYLFESDLLEFGRYDFNIFSITFEDNSIIEISRESINSRQSYRFEDFVLNVVLKKIGVRKTNNFSIKSNDLLENFRSTRQGVYRTTHSSRIVSMIRNFIPTPLDRVGQDRWLDVNSGLIFNTTELIRHYSHFFPKDMIEELTNKSIPDWFITLTKSLKVKLVETQRLLTKLSSDEKEYKSSVLQYSNELKEIIRNKTLEATNLSTKLDRTYTNRLIEKITSTNNSSNTIIDFSLNDLEEKRSFLIKVGLLEQDEEVIIPINFIQDNETLRNVLEIYIDDSNAKLSVYYELSLKLNTLIDIINKRFNFKHFSINKNDGFIFKSTITNKKIPLSNLSSGEQHELVLFYELLFNTPENSLILIDEPEISLHINWQNEFINDLQEINKINNIKSIIATHSPDIINNNWDLTIDLNEE